MATGVVALGGAAVELLIKFAPGIIKGVEDIVEKLKGQHTDPAAPPAASPSTLPTVPPATPLPSGKDKLSIVTWALKALFQQAIDKKLIPADANITDDLIHGLIETVLQQMKATGQLSAPSGPPLSTASSPISYTDAIYVLRGGSITRVT